MRYFDGFTDMDYAGRYLTLYEGSRYTWSEKYSHKLSLPVPTETLADLSFYQQGTDWSIYKQNARAAILRLGQGGWKDPAFEQHYQEARENNVALGGYYFFDGRFSPTEQARVAITAMQEKNLELELFVDWERSYSGPYEGLPYVVTLMRMLESAGLNVKGVGLYTGYYWFTENTILDRLHYPYLAEKPLWIAWYAATAMVRIPSPWTDWKYWQSGTPVLNWGQPTREIDFNHYNGTPAQFQERYLGATMFVEGTVTTAGANLNVRQSANLTAPIVGTIPNGTSIYGFLENGWIRGTFNGINGYISAQYVSYVPVEARQDTEIVLTYDESHNVELVKVDGVEWVRP
jgi:GH25 family lysozyme M1 (1,4-beta-N-acetylmuramidase)